MSQYKFRLQKLLDIRHQKEEEAKVLFTKAVIQKKEVEDELDNLYERLKKFHKLPYCKTSVEQKIRFQYICALENSIEVTKKELIKKDKTLEEKRQELSDRQKERKTVEILKEKGEAAFLKEESLKEQRSIDELALYGFIRNVKGGEKDAG